MSRAPCNESWLMLRAGPQVVNEIGERLETRVTAAMGSENETSVLERARLQ